MEEIKVKCPICKKYHKIKTLVDFIYCKNVPLALINDRLGWRLMEIKIITENQDSKLDKMWGSEDEG